MEILPRALTALTDELGRLPGIGPKSAQRLAFHVLRQPAGAVARLSHALVEVKAGIGFCQQCAFIAEGALCPICRDDRRDRRVICVVEEPMDVVAIERTGEYPGLYHVLLGAISPMDGVGPQDIRVAELLARLGGVAEVILATNGDVEGEATAAFLAQELAQNTPAVRVSRLARSRPRG